jgi:hypothetical protein
MVFIALSSAIPAGQSGRGERDAPLMDGRVLAVYSFKDFGAGFPEGDTGDRL